MRDLLNGAGRPADDLSKRMGDNVVEALVTYMQAPGTATGEAVHAYSIALNSLALLAIAEQLQTLNEMLAPEVQTAEQNPTVLCIKCQGSGCANDGAEICSLCNGVGRLEAYVER